MRRRIGNSTLQLLVGDMAQQPVEARVIATDPGRWRENSPAAADHPNYRPPLKENGRPAVGGPSNDVSGTVTKIEEGNLSEKVLLHAVGPVWKGGRQGEPELLRFVYEKCLQIAAQQNCSSLALPPISIGTGGYPTDLAAMTSLSAIIDVLSHLSVSLEVRLVFDREGTFGAYSRTLDELLPESGNF